MVTVTKMKKQKIQKTRVGIFKSMGGNIPGRNFLGWNFPGGNSPGGSLIGGNFSGGSFPDTVGTLILAIKNSWKIVLNLEKKFF